jgi:hypothetical protein
MKLIRVKCSDIDVRAISNFGGPDARELRKKELKGKRISELEKIAGVQASRKMQLFQQEQWLIDYILNKENPK